MDRRRGPVSRYFASRPLLVNLLLMAALGFYIPLELLFRVGFGTYSFGVSLAFFVLQVVSIAAVWWRNRFPLGVFGVVTACDILAVLLPVAAAAEPGAGGTFASFAAMYAVAKWRSHRTAWICAAVLMMIFAVYVGLITGIKGGFWASLLSLLVGMPLAFSSYLVVIMLGFRARRDRLHQWDVRAWAAAQSATAQLEERARIAREMHDVVAHSLTVMIALADGARATARKNPERGSEIMAEVSSTGRAALADMRRVLGVLKSDAEAAPLAPPPAMDALHELIAGFRTAGVPVTLVQDGERWPEDPAFQQTVYRIVQESLTNVLRYARSAGTVTVELHTGPDGSRIRVSDNALSAPPDESRRPAFQGTGNGLAGLATRVKAFGGTFRAGPQQPTGWLVEAAFPPLVTPAPRSFR